MSTVINDRQLSGIDASLWVTLQTQSGEIQPTPEFQQFRRTDGRPLTTLTYGQSGEIKSNRQGLKNILENSEYAAEISSEFTFQTVPFLTAGIHSDAPVDGGFVDFATIAATATGFLDSGGTAFANLSVNDWVYMTNFTDSSIDGWYKIQTKVSDGEITTFSAPPATEAEGALVSGESVKYVSGKTQCYYVLQDRQEDDSEVGGISYETYFDAPIQTFSFEIPTSGLITVTQSFLPQSKVDGYAAIAGQTDAPDDLSTPLTASGSSNFRGFYYNGVLTQNCSIKSGGFSVENGYEADQCAGRLGSSQVIGQPTYTAGTMTVASPESDSKVWFKRFASGERFSLAQPFFFDSGASVIIDMPQVLATGYTPATGAGILNAEVETAIEEGPDGYTVAVFTNGTL